MKKMSIIGFIILVLSLSIYSEATIRFKVKTVNFGEIEIGKIKNIQFEFENIGDSLLVIKKISSSCGCTVAELQKKEYTPGETGIMIIRFNSRGYFGEVTKTLTVKTNDKNNSRIRLNFFGEVISKRFSMLKLGSKSIDYSGTKVGKKYQKTIKLKNYGTIDLKILEITHPPEFIPEFSKYTLTPGEKADLVIFFKPMRVGKSVHLIRIITDSHKHLTAIKISTEVEG